MQLSEQWLREWVSPNISTEELVEQLTMAGLEVDGVEPAAGVFSKVFVGQVTERAPHPDADKLSVCKVDVGAEEVLQIVCGAANVREGLKIPVAIVGAVLPGDFKIKKAKLRGVESMGMLCAEAELGLADKSDGLMELAEDAPIGTGIREYLNLDDQIIDVDLTPNRGDCLSLAGVAREVGVLNAETVNELAIEAASESITDTFPVEVLAPQANPRYLGRVIKGVNLNALTPLWMSERLRRGGIRTIDPIVDVTNYVLLELGQPMHAFDLDKLSGGIRVRMAEDGEKITLLDGQEIKLKSDTLVIADHEKALAIAGVMGGLDSSVTSETKNILLESAFFEPVSIAGKARGYGLHTDSSHRFERGVDFALQQKAMERATSLLLEIAGGEAGPIVEVSSESDLPKLDAITLRAEKIKRVLGLDVAADEVTRILTQLGMTPEVDADGWKVTPPSYRFDIRIEEDLVEEVGRIYGYNRLPITVPVAECQVGAQPEGVLNRDVMRRALVNRGYQEAVSYSFVDPAILKVLDPEATPKALANPISKDMAVMRTTLLAGLLPALKYNLNRQQTRVRLFETGLRFVVEKDGSLTQQMMVAGVITGPLLPENWNHDKHIVDFYDLKGDVEALVNLGANQDQFEFSGSENNLLHPGQSAELSLAGESVGSLGCLHPSVAKSLGLNNQVFVFELELDAILRRNIPKFEEVSKFPEVRRDIALVVGDEVAAADLVKAAQEAAGDTLSNIIIFDVYQGDNVEKGQKSLALGLTLQHPSRTLTDVEVAEQLDRVIALLKQRFKAILRD